MERIECVVIGAGVVGLALARELAMAGREVVILESEDRFGTGTSSRNSEVIHAGMYYATGTLKARLCPEGNRTLYEFCRARQIGHRRCGKLIVAAAPGQVEALLRIQAQAAAIQSAREHREKCRDAVALSCSQPESAHFSCLIPLLPPDYRPLLQALVHENNQLLGRIHKRARQNHVLLRRSVELMRDLLRTLFPARQTSLNNGNGLKRGQIINHRPLCNAVG